MLIGYGCGVTNKFARIFRALPDGCKPAMWLMTKVRRIPGDMVCCFFKPYLFLLRTAARISEPFGLSFYPSVSFRKGLYSQLYAPWRVWLTNKNPAPSDSLVLAAVPSRKNQIESDPMTQLQKTNLALPEGADSASAIDEDAPFECLAGSVDKGLVLICDHASNHLPAKYGLLGLRKEEFERHIAYDIGAAEVTRLMSAHLGVPAILSRFSRLLIDPNRAPDDPTLIMQLSDGAVIPGNTDISSEQRQQRLTQYYEPYHRAIESVIDQSINADHPPALVSIHSFTQEWHGTLRPWEAALLWDHDDRLVKPLLNCLRKETDFSIGDNEPYSGRLQGDCMYRHGTSRGLAHALVEIRQDQIRDEQGQGEWAGRLSDILTRIMANPELAAELAVIRK